MSNKRKNVGPVSVYLTREQVNALIYLLDCFPATDSNSVFARDAEKLKRKILLHGRTFIDHGEEKVSLYFYDNEAQKLIMLTSLYLSAFGNEVPDGDTIGRFRNLLEKNGIQEKIFASVVKILEERALILKKGTIVDSTLIAAPSSTKNQKKKRDPEAHSTKKGNQWHFGYKGHIGVDEESGLVHHVKVTSANEADVTAVPDLLYGEEDRVGGDSGYLGADKRKDAVKKNKAGKKIKYNINRRPSSLKKLSRNGQYYAKKKEHEKSSVRCKVEHVFAIVKRLFRYRKTRYRGLRKQTAKLNIMFALANLYLADRKSLTA